MEKKKCNCCLVVKDVCDFGKASGLNKITYGSYCTKCRALSNQFNKKARRLNVKFK